MLPEEYTAALDKVGEGGGNDGTVEIQTTLDKGGGVDVFRRELRRNVNKGKLKV